MEKVWLVTGCSSGIGKGIAKAALKNNDRVVMTARNVDTLKELQEQYPDTSLAVRLDITKSSEIDQAVSAAIGRFGRIDYLVNNAGYGYRGATEEAGESEIMELFRTNFFGPVELIRKVLPYMRKEKTGSIINISSSGALEASVGSGFYAASKAALEQVSDSLRQETQGLGIRVLIVEPGAVRTDFRDRSLKESETVIEAYQATSGKRRKENLPSLHDQPGSPELVGEVLVELTGKEDIPKRLLLGSDGVDTAKRVYSERLAEIERWREISVRTDFF